ncbi:unnamed protein product [Tuwongella immobilis]|uniref:Zinc-finger domain-containing protein n=1 Tax=Tuwongella immobilis TaxID=692036 RepID=A0A6C2YMB2_9BACT|nr:unnamed protein product [Tuwongella immobilis]VTS01438.1 unnamed protein product [Tuwongella immobilis]
MSHTGSQPPLPWPQLLAGYADGELPPDLADRIDAWLREHPEELELLETQMRLASSQCDLWQQTTPIDPTESQWRTVQESIRESLSPTVPKSAEPTRATSGLLRAITWAIIPSCALALLIAIGPLQPKPAPVFEPISERESNDFFEIPTLAAMPIALHDDIEITCLHESDCEGLLVGDSPHRETFDWATSEDLSIARDHSSTVRDSSFLVAAPEANRPMILIPFSGSTPR